jgi:hypothetical protein
MSARSGGPAAKLVDRASSILERRTSRRSFLSKVALTASAIAVAPVKFLARPVNAMAVITCSDCSPGDLCCDGWTVFCCTLHGQNSCPSYTYMGGWWKCTDYSGNGLCSTEGVRYYIDCNRTPTASCPNGCHCGNDKCSHRATCCNIFRYGQCNTEITGVTEVVCRMVTCAEPSTLFVDCNHTYFQDNATCTHDADCLS